MALPDSTKLVDGTNFIVAFDTDWPATPAYGWSATVNAEMDMQDITTGLYEQSVKLDLTANRDTEYSVKMIIEMATDPTAGNSIDLYVSYSDSGTAGTGNMAGLSGTAAAYTGAATGTAANGVKAMEFVGSLNLDVLNDLDAVQTGDIGVFSPKGRYAMFVIHNNSAVSTHSVADNMALQIRAVTTQTQD